ncbi:unnamed protein product, partial [Linum tenue]
MPSFSPAQEALFLIHERILESESEFVGGGGGGVNNRVAMRLVGSRMHVGCLLGKVLYLWQVVGDADAVKNAIAAISSRLRESQHRDRSNFHGRAHSPERVFPDEDYVPHMNNAPCRSSDDGHSFGSRSSGNNYRGDNYSARMPEFGIDSSSLPDGTQSSDGDELVFRMLCPTDKINIVVGEADGILKLLQNEIGVEIKISDPSSGSGEHKITILSEEGPDDDMFPAQEALLHIQTRIVDLVLDQDSVTKTWLLVPNSEVGCLVGRELLSEMERLTGAKVQIMTKLKVPAFISGTDELVQDSGGSVLETARPNESEQREDVPATMKRIPMTLVTRSILEVVIPDHAVPKLVTKSKNKLAQISEVSGAPPLLEAPDPAPPLETPPPFEAPDAARPFETLDFTPPSDTAQWLLVECSGTASATTTRRA